ncbi:MAG: exo-alpha-sialidase [Cyclobacteriaceae bacterium]|nr:exo-alpha-sialidase [Cyclobacteriaceae bacterium]UYN87947.1 MAG: exo-alpha-sialidase [Cyclobacteriaceae bacterium]
MTRHCILIITALLSSCTAKEEKSSILPFASPGQSPSSEPYLFTAPSGKVFLSWIEQQDSINFLKMAAWEGEGWSEPRLITSGTNWFVNWADYPMAISNDQEKFIAHYLEKSADGTFTYDVKVATSHDGITWSTPFTLHDDGKEAEHGFVSWVPYGENFFVSWLDGRNTVSDDTTNHSDHGHHGEMSLRAAVLNTEGMKIEEWELDTRTCDCCQTTSTITTNGPVVIYRDRSDEEVRDISIVRLVNNQWTKPKAIYQDNWEIKGCPVNGPRCEAIGNTLAIAWFTMANNDPAVKVVFSTDGGETFSAPIRIDDGEAIGRVDLVMLDENTAMVSWMEGSQIKILQVNKNGSKGKSMIVASSSQARASGFPQLTKTKDGAMMAWTDSESRSIKTALIKW